MISKKEALEKVPEMARQMRKHILDMALAAGARSSHLGGGLSLVEMTATLYGAVLQHDPKNPEWSERDRFILSKGHGVLGYYTALAEAGYFPAQDLLQFEQSGSDFLGHPVRNLRRGIESSNGSLGMGLSYGVGLALAFRKKAKSSRVFVLIGDGECNEGSVWEAALSASQFQLSSLTVLIDRNHFQQTGSGEEILNLGDLASKWSSFGWDVVEVDGHDVGQLYDACLPRPESNQPRAIVAQTIKGKGLSFAEGKNEWHHKILTRELYEQALAELGFAGKGGAIDV